jgi:hypothetical protein
MDLEHIRCRAFVQPVSWTDYVISQTICDAAFRPGGRTHREAWCYLISRGFSCRPDGRWVNGRWADSVGRTVNGSAVAIWLRQCAA